MARIIIPRKQTPQDMLPMAGGVAGGVIGGISGGPAGAVGGFSAGSSAGSILSSGIDEFSGENKKRQAIELTGAEMSQAKDPTGGVFGGMKTAASVYNMGSALSGGGGDAPKGGTSWTGGDAMTRRMQTIDENPTTQLAQGKAALKALPIDMQKEYEPVLDEAYTRSIRQRQSRGSTYG